MNTKELNDYLYERIKDLAEHFDTLTVIGTNYDAEKKDTEIHSVGFGNFYARAGAVHSWLVREDEQVRCKTRDEHAAEKRAKEREGPEEEIA